MPRVKRSVHAHKKRREILEQAKGYRGARRKRLRVAKEQLLHSGAYAYRDRRDRKGQFRRLWISRIGAASRQHGMTYSTFMHGLKETGIDIISNSPFGIGGPKGMDQKIVKMEYD